MTAGPAPVIIGVALFLTPTMFRSRSLAAPGGRTPPDVPRGWDERRLLSRSSPCTTASTAWSGGAGSPARVISPSGGRFHSQQSRSAADPQISAAAPSSGPSATTKRCTSSSSPFHVPVTRTGVTVHACMASTVTMVSADAVGTCERLGLWLVAAHDAQGLVDAVGGEPAVERACAARRSAPRRGDGSWPREPAGVGCSRPTCRRPTSTAASPAAGRESTCCSRALERS